MEHEYIIEAMPLGWLVCAPAGADGIPVSFYSECERMFPKKAVMDLGIARHFKVQGRRAVICIATKENAARWRKEITESMAHLPPMERWWKGVDVGKSSSAIFAALCPDSLLAAQAREYGCGATPLDADDLGRCLRLLSAIPEFKLRLGEIATAYPGTPWPQIVARWPKLEAASPAEQSAILSELRKH